MYWLCRFILFFVNGGFLLGCVQNCAEVLCTAVEHWLVLLLDDGDCVGLREYSYTCIRRRQVNAVCGGFE